MTIHLTLLPTVLIVTGIFIAGWIVGQFFTYTRLRNSNTLIGKILMFGK